MHLGQAAIDCIHVRHRSKDNLFNRSLAGALATLRNDIDPY